MDEVEDAVRVLEQYGLGTVTSSTGGRRVSLLLRRIMEGPDGELNDLTALAKKAADEGLPKELVIEEWTKKAADVLEELIPEGAFERALPIRAAKGVIEKRRPLDEAFARLYMGMNLGYAWRNLASNAGIGVVMGWSPYVRNAKIVNYFDELGYTVEAAARGIGSVGGTQYMAEAGPGITTGGLWLGQEGEKLASRTYVYQAHSDAVGKLWKDAMKQFDFGALGLDEATNRWLQGRVAAQGKMGLDELVATRATLAKRLGVEGPPPAAGVPPVPVPEMPPGGGPLPTAFEPWRQPSQQLVDKMSGMGDELLAEVQEAARQAENSEDLMTRLRAMQRRYAEHTQDVVKAVDDAEAGLGPVAGTTASEAITQVVRSDKFGPEDLEELGKSIGLIEDGIRTSRARAFGSAMSSADADNWVRYLDEIESTFQAEMKALRKDQLVLYGKLDAGEVTTTEYTQQLFEAYAQKRSWLDQQYSKVIGEAGGVEAEIISGPAAVRRELALEAQRAGIPSAAMPDGTPIDILKIDEYYTQYGPHAEVVPHRDYTKKLNALMETKGKPKKLGQWSEEELFEALNRFRDEAGKPRLESPDDLLGGMAEARRVGREMGEELFYPGLAAAPPGWDRWDDFTDALKNAPPGMRKKLGLEIDDAMDALEKVNIGEAPVEDLRVIDDLILHLRAEAERLGGVVPDDMLTFIWHDPETKQQIWASLDDAVFNPPPEIDYMGAMVFRRAPDGTIEASRASLHMGGDELIRGMRDPETGTVQFMEGVADKSTEDMATFAQDLISQGIPADSSFQQIINQRKWEGTLEDVATGLVPSRFDSAADEMFAALFPEGLPPTLSEQLVLGRKGAEAAPAARAIEWLGPAPEPGNAILWDPENSRLINVQREEHALARQRFGTGPGTRDLFIYTGGDIVVRDAPPEDVNALAQALLEGGLAPGTEVRFTRLGTYGDVPDPYIGTHTLDEAARIDVAPERLWEEALEVAESPAARLENVAALNEAEGLGSGGMGVINGDTFETTVEESGQTLETFFQASNSGPGALGVWYTPGGVDDPGNMMFRVLTEEGVSPESAANAHMVAREMWEQHPGITFVVEAVDPETGKDITQAIIGGNFDELSTALRQGPVAIVQEAGEALEDVARIADDITRSGAARGFEPGAVIDNLGGVATGPEGKPAWDDFAGYLEEHSDMMGIEFMEPHLEYGFPNRVTISSPWLSRSEDVPPLMQQRALEIVQELKGRYPDLEVNHVSMTHTIEDLLGLPPITEPAMVGTAADGSVLRAIPDDPRGTSFTMTKLEPHPESGKLMGVEQTQHQVKELRSWTTDASLMMQDAGYKRDPWMRPPPEIPPKGQAPGEVVEVGFSAEQIARKKALIEKKLAKAAEAPPKPTPPKGVPEADVSWYHDPNTDLDVQVYIPDHTGEISYEGWQSYMDGLMGRVSETEEGKLVASAVKTLDNEKIALEVSTTPSVIDAARMGGEEAVKVLDEVAAEVDALGRIPPPPPPPSAIPTMPPEFEGFLAQVEDAYMQTQAMASQVAKHARDSALLDYRDRRTFDPILQSIYPWVYWHTRSIPNWIGGLAMNPSAVAKYMRVKSWNRVRNDKDPTIPDWAKDTLVISPPGYNGSLYLNLEATFNPIQQMLEGFDDPDQEKGAFGKALNQISIFGPAPHPLLMMAYAAERGILHGDTDAVRSLGYLAPITRAFTSVTGKTMEPWLWLEDAKTGKRVPWKGGAKWDIGKAGRMLGAAEGRGEVTPEEAAMGVARQAGPTFEEALDAALATKRVPALASTLLGLRITPRADWEKDLTLRSRQYQALKAQVGSKEAAQQTLADAPWMGTVWMAYDNEVERISGLAWDVFGRLPPGYDAEDIFYKAGITPEMRDFFYESKGDLSAWDPLDYEAFTRGVINLGEIIGGPSAEVAEEWRQARAMRSQLYAEAQELFPGMQEVQDTYWTIANAQGKESANLYASESGLFKYWDWLSESMVSEPLLLKYYADEGDSKSAAYALRAQAAEAQWPGVMEKQDTYWTLDKPARRTFLKQNPELKTYWDWSKGAIDYYSSQLDALRKAAQAGAETDLELIGGESDLNLQQRAVMKALKENRPVPAAAAVAGQAPAKAQPRPAYTTYTRGGNISMGTTAAVLRNAAQR
jgi:hypothetical protein